MDEGKGIAGIVGLVTGFLLGSVAGLIVGILLAPQSGEETRDIIKEKGIELKSRAGELSEESRVRFQEAIEEGKTVASKKKEELTKALEKEKAAAAKAKKSTS
jgi:gas vesicle protein